MIRNIIRFILILGVVCAVMGGGVAVLYAVFRGDLARREDTAREEALLAACPAGATLDAASPVAGAPFAADAVYAARDASGRAIAYVAGGEASGYSSVVRLVVGVQAADRAIVRVVVVSQAETPGLGANVAEQKSNFTLWEKLFGPSQAGKTEQSLNPFLDQFRGKTVDRLGEVHAMTAATITSNAAKAAVEQAVARIQKVVDQTK